MEKSKKKFLYIIIDVILILIPLLIVWNKFQEDSFFYPWNDTDSYKELQKIAEFKEIKINNKEVNLSGWFWNIQNKSESAPLVIFFTGNAQNSSNTLYKYYTSEKMKDVFGNYNLMIIDYPGYGLSKGKPSDKSMFKASEYIIEYATKMKEVDKKNIVIMGYSIGTGVAVYAASKNDVNGLILVAPYDNALSLYNDTLNIFHGFIKHLTRYSFDSVKYSENVREPTLIFTSKEDEVINYKHSLDLSTHFSNLENVIILDNVTHNNYYSQTQVLNDITGFLNKVIK